MALLTTNIVRLRLLHGCLEVQRPTLWVPLKRHSWPQAQKFSHKQCQADSTKSETDKALDDEELLLRDMERYKQRDAQRQLSEMPGPSGREEGSDRSAMGQTKELLDKVLIADFFFVCVALAWLVAGVGAKASLNNSALLDAWYPLWQWVFQPAIGVLMLGALVSGAVGWMQKNSS